MSRGRRLSRDRGRPLSAPILLALAAFLASSLGATAQVEEPGARARRFDPAVWITLKDFRHVTAVATDEAVAYLGTTEGVERFDTLRDGWLPPLTDADGLPDRSVTALAVEPAGGDVWIGTARGLVRFLPFSDELEPVFGPPPARVDGLWIDVERGVVHARIVGAWWEGSAGGPVLERSDGPPAGAALEGAVAVADVDPFDLPWTDPLFVDSPAVPGGLFPLTVLDRDPRGDWYVGTWGDNGRRWGAGRASWEPLYFGLAGPGGGPIVRAGDRTWFFPGGDATPLAASATAALGGTRLSAATTAAPAAIAHADDQGRWGYAVPGAPPAPPVAVAAAATSVGDTVYVGTAAGLQRGVAGEWVAWGATNDPRLGPVTALAVEEGRLWVGTEDGLLAWDRAAGRATRRVLDDRRVTALAVAPDVLFVGTDLGLHGAERVEGTDPAAWPRLATRGHEIRALALRGALLVVATEAGLEAFDRTRGTWTVTPARTGRLPGVPLAVAADAENVWVGTTEALVRWRPATDEWEAYRPADGLAGVPVRHLLVESGAVWASTPSGATRFAWTDE